MTHPASDTYRKLSRAQFAAFPFPDDRDDVDDAFDAAMRVGDNRRTGVPNSPELLRRAAMAYSLGHRVALERGQDVGEMMWAQSPAIDEWYNEKWKHSDED